MIEFQDMGNWFRMKRLLETNKQTNKSKRLSWGAKIDQIRSNKNYEMKRNRTWGLSDRCYGIGIGRWGTQPSREKENPNKLRLKESERDCDLYSNISILGICICKRQKVRLVKMSHEIEKKRGAWWWWCCRCHHGRWRVPLCYILSGMPSWSTAPHLGIFG